jgi:hypothetical protein
MSEKRTKKMRIESANIHRRRFDDCHKLLGLLSPLDQMFED